MTSYRLFSAVVAAALLFSNQRLGAAEDAVVKADRVSLRAEPSSRGERLPGTLKKGEVVHVIEEVEDPQAKGNEPRRWARIEMPELFTVWVAAELVDSKSLEVKGDKVNLRSGPGKNFSRVGQIDKGTKVTEIRTEEGWMQIEAPKGSQAYVAADLIEKKGTKSAPATVAKAAAPAAATQIPQPDRSNPKWITSTTPARPIEPAAATPTAPPARPATPPPARVTTPEPAPAEVVANNPTSLPPSDPPPVEPLVTTPAPPPPPVYSTPARAPKTLSTTNWVETNRKVLREGLLLTSLNPTAPSGYVLTSKRRSEGTLNYVYNTNATINLRKFVNHNVLISGEEWVDPQLKRLPILVVESIERQ